MVTGNCKKKQGQNPWVQSLILGEKTSIRSILDYHILSISANLYHGVSQATFPTPKEAPPHLLDGRGKTQSTSNCFQDSPALFQLKTPYLWFALKVVGKDSKYSHMVMNPMIESVYKSPSTDTSYPRQSPPKQYRRLHVWLQLPSHEPHWCLMKAVGCQPMAPWMSYEATGSRWAPLM